jgi:CRISPR-associated endonuclease/helicase Cas3
LSDFVIGTIDQVLMAGLKQKHLVLRHLGLVNKVVILDECHAYDAYMNRYLYKVLNWLGAYEVPVIVLSATLPGSKRMQLIEAYLNSAPEPEYDPLFDREMAQAPPLPSWANTHDYPIITYTDGGKIFREKIGGKQRSIKVKLDILPEDERIVSVLEHLLSEGGCAGIIVNTVKRAQQIAYNLSQIFGNECILLLHSRFIAADRAQKEKELYEKLSVGGERPHRYIAVGTQIFEQSCDLDFDVLISDICPMDLLIQRIGRLHRHRRSRPVKLKAPRCFILGMNDSGFDRGAEIIYGKYLLMNTRARLPDQITLPDDIPQLVQQVYGTGELCFSPEIQDEYDEAKKLHEKRISEKEVKAQDFQIYNPNVGTGNLVGWLDRKISDDPSGKRGEATVRDVENSLEVIVVQRRHNAYYMLPRSGKHSDQYDQYEQYKERKISTDTPPAAELAREMAACSIQLPHELCRNMDNTIGELEKLSLKELRVWQQSSWLKGELFLVLDEQYCADLCGYQLRYDQYYGMFSNKNDKGDEDAGERI